MRKSITVHPITHVMKLPKEAIEDGFVGELDSYPNAATFTLVRPGAGLEDVEASLVRTLDDIRQRMKLGMNRPPAKVESSAEPDEIQDKAKIDKAKIEERLGKLEDEFDKMRRKIMKARGGKQ